MTVDSNDVGCEEVVQQLHKQVAELQRELISRDDRVADLTREVAYWQALLRTERSAVEARRPSIDRTTQTFAGPFAVDAATDTTDDLLPTPLHSPNLGNKGAPHQRPRRVSVLEDTSGDDRAPLLLSARAPTLTRQYVTPPQLAIPAVPLLNLATPRQVAYGGQLSYRAVHQLPNGDYTHASYSPTPREQWTYQGSGLLRNLETPRTTPPLLPGRQYDSTVIDSLTAPSSPMETSPAQFDIDPEGGCGICQLANQALAFMHNHSGADEQLQLPTTQAAILRWMVEDLTRLADAHVHSTTADEQRDMLAVLKTVAASTVDTVSPPIAPIDLDSNALHHLVTSEGALTVAVRVAVEAGGAFTRGRLWATSQGLALIGVQVENSAWRLHSMLAVRCCAVKCSRSGRDGKFTIIRRREEALGAPPSILQWPITETRMNDSLSTAANFDPQPGTVTFLAEMQDVVPLKQQLDLIASTCPHHAIQALREGAIPLALCANALIANPGVNHS